MPGPLDEGIYYQIKGKAGKEAKVPPNIHGYRTENHSGSSPSLHFQNKIGKNEQ